MTNKKIVAVTATILNGIIALLKITVGITSGSMAMLADGIDSSTDIFTSLTMYISVHVSSKPPDLEQPYGHEKAETIGAKIISLVIFYAGASLLISSTKRIILGEYHVIQGNLPIIVLSLSIAIKTFLFTIEYYVGKRENSKALISEAMNMRNDILISSAVLIGVLLNKVGLIILDPIISIILSLFIIRTAINIFRDSVYELMDGIPPEDLHIYEKIKQATRSCQYVKRCKRIRVRKMGNYYIVDAEIIIDSSLTLGEVENIKKRIKRYVQSAIPRLREINIIAVPDSTSEMNINCEKQNSQTNES